MKLLDKLLHSAKKDSPHYIHFTDSAGVPRSAEMVELCAHFSNAFMTREDYTIPKSAYNSIAEQINAIPKSHKGAMGDLVLWFMEGIVKEPAPNRTIEDFVREDE